MKFALALCLLMLSACSSVSHSDISHDEHARQILITVNLDNSSPISGSPGRIFSYPKSYSQAARAKQLLREISLDYQLSGQQSWSIKSLGVLCQVFSIEQERASSVVSQLTSDSRVESAQLMNEFETLANPDPMRNLQSNLDQLHVSAVHNVATGRNIKVAVIDTRIDIDHPELSGRIDVQENMISDSNVKADIHGTAVAGIIGAKRFNGVGISGVAPEASIVALTACWAVQNASGRCNSFTLARALDRAVSNNVKVINLSLSGPSDRLLSRLVNHALDKNIIIVGAYDTNDKNTFPSTLDGVISVASSAMPGSLIAAPGNEVLTTTPNGGYDFLSGSSFAAAHVSGVAALALEVAPDLQRDQLLKALTESTQLTGTLDACTTLGSLLRDWRCPTDTVATTPSLD